MLKFANSNTIDKNTNIEGSIKLEYEVVSKKEISSKDNIFDSQELRNSLEIEFGEDECTHQFNKELQASLNDIIYSSNMTFNY